MARGSAKSVRKITRERLRKTDDCIKKQICNAHSIGQNGIVQSASMGEEGDDGVDGEYYVDDNGGWFSCECIFSLILVGVLAALPFNFHSKDLLPSQDTYFLRAEELFRDGAFDKAVSLYERALNVQETAEAHSYLANALAECGRHEDALAHYFRAIDYEQNERLKVPSLLAVGNLQMRLGRPELAVKNFEQVLSIQVGDDSPEVGTTHLRAAISLIDSHKYEAAINHLQAAHSMFIDLPSVAEVNRYLGESWQRLGKHDLAVISFNKAIKLQPKNYIYVIALADAYMEMGDYKAALALFRKALELAPDTVSLQYTVAAVSGEKYLLDRAPKDYVSSLFDRIAHRSRDLVHESKKNLDHLQQSSCPSNYPPNFCFAHGFLFESFSQKIARALQNMFGIRDGDRWLDVMELGCGYGLSGISLRGLANYLIGIDISPISVASAKSHVGLYDDIELGDIIEVLPGTPICSMDLIIAVDTLPYFGDLRNIFKCVYRILRSGGAFALSIDVALPQDLINDQEYTLQFTGRWAHSIEYLMQLIKENRFLIEHTEELIGWQKFARDVATNMIEIADHPIRKVARIYLLRKKEEC